MPSGAMAGLVLCGGASRRMGTDKALLDVDGEVLLFRVARRLAAVCRPVLVAPGTRGRLGALPWPEVADAPDVPAGAGPLAGIVAGLRASPEPWMAVVAVDQPLIDPDLLRWLHRHRRDESAAVPVDGAGRPQPLHAVYPRSAAPALAAGLAAGQRRVIEAVVAAGATLLPVGPAFPETWAFNLNERADVERLAPLLAGPPPDHGSGGRGEGRPHR